ncbi:hypothetical protein ACTXT7_013267 [Hymenolepis weldensis]
MLAYDVQCLLAGILLMMGIRMKMVKCKAANCIRIFAEKKMLFRNQQYHRSSGAMLNKEFLLMVDSTPQNVILTVYIGFSTSLSNKIV